MPRLSKIGAAALAAFGWTGLASVSASYLVVAGGGGGGFNGGGGGAGGLLTGTASLNLTLSYTVTVGGGGSGGTSNSSSNTGTNGSNSVFSSFTAIGGGSGGDYARGSGNNGGSGGGVGGDVTGGLSGTVGTGSQGSSGGQQIGSGNWNGGGGGGASAVGGNGVSGTRGGNGGAGTASSISGTSVTYAGGGGGASNMGASTGGSGGGGNGAFSGTSAGTNGTANTGGGGGGNAASYGNGNTGGSGVVIISYTSATQLFGGGTVTQSGGNFIHTFTSSGALSPLSSVSASYLVVAGGGAGARRDAAFGGGGGAGGLQTGSGLVLDANSIYTVTVGGGGTTAADSVAGGSGTNSTFSALTTASVGGGGGGAASTTAPSGGSGGGGTHVLGTGGAGTSGQGFAGGSILITNNIGGGGGGSSAVGSTGATGTGGAGTASSISGSSVTYAGGGGGGGNGAAGGSGGSGGGGAGANGSSAGVAGTTNLGGGGGGGGYNTLSGGAGGSGVVIISYAGSQIFGGGTVTSSGGNVIHTFTSSGYLTPIKLVNNSLRFRSSASAYLNRTPATASNRKTWTWSGWVKRGTLSSGYPVLFMGGAAQTDTGATCITFAPNDRIYVQGYNTNWIISNGSYRDPAAWYHIVVAMDSTQATATNRLKLYVNGSEVSYSTYNNLTQNTDYGINQAASHTIAYQSVAFGNTYFDGYMTEVNFIDGQQLTPNSFGTFNSYGVWQPITYGGSYGTNGFYLPFTNKTSTTTLGYDFSPNGNNWTPNNISVTAGVTYDSMQDVPTLTSATAANYAVLNPLDKNTSSITISDGNLKYATSGTNFGVRGSISVSSGKWYWETTITAVGTGSLLLGIANATWDLTYVGSTSGSYGYFSANGNKGNNTSFSAYGATFTTNDVIGIALDMDSGTLTFYKNNTSQGTAFTGLSGSFFPAFSGQTSDSAAVNFGQRPFSYTPPTGFVALNTYNIPTSTITNGAAYMAATTFNGVTGGGSVVNTVNGVYFQPDMVWMKSRNAIHNHEIADSVRGTPYASFPNLTNAEVSDTRVSAFNSNGFSFGTNSNSAVTGETEVGWQWKKGASSGFDIVSQTLATTGINTITHTLNAVPTMVLAKKTSGIEQWLVYQASGTTQSQYLGLNTTAAVATSANLWGSSAFTSSQIYFNGTSGNTYVFYIFATVAGYSAFGSYTGNGSTDGPFVYTGFRPRWVMVKDTTNTNTYWVIYDTSRNTYNLTNSAVYANASAAEGAYQGIDALSNGFKLRAAGADTNASSATIIYAAFAENPLKFANAR